MDAKGRREVYFVVLLRIHGIARGGEVSIEYAFCGRNKIHTVDGGGARNDRGCTGGASSK